MAATTDQTQPRMIDILTVIITTSVTPSIPYTDLISAILDGYSKYCPQLLRCRFIVVFDNYDLVVPFARLKKGHVTPQQAKDWNLYKTNAKQLILQQFYSTSGEVHMVTERGEAEYGSPQSTNGVPFTAKRTVDNRVTFIEPERRLGFGLAVRSALRLVDTPYVWLQQHDWSLVASIPIESVLQVMQGSENDPEVPIKYICLPAKKMLSYATSQDVVRFPALQELTLKLQRNFSPSLQPEIKIPLTPLYFWHDKPHIASTAHYLARVYPSRLAMLRGDFIEDKIGHRARDQMKEGLWSKWGTWLYYPDEGRQLCLRHLNGRVWRGEDGQSKQINTYREQNINYRQELDGELTNVTSDDDFELENFF
ncbi:hypothetical protein BKA67DRAFT_549883 [Truncatella angustata]|uniref:Uncharacterized protein n=1 Tax=Truncatella angustata TaxID=152316 RepID=A0A9P9A3Z6_9PEZI|nr:uncharacterized protein BKA67DRAFT_549883 [Truncatella angustata]KAH6661007.1 hypothetical protein BKA67DRAFT_549883 [Truncatella angustata]KAH8203718.1 hypothetical protein TruAng_002131 [Truncatella angustata]